MPSTTRSWMQRMPQWKTKYKEEGADASSFLRRWLGVEKQRGDLVR